MEKQKQTSLKPQDVVVCLKLLLENRDTTIQFLSKSLLISTGEVHVALKRAKKSRLLISDGGEQKVVNTALVEFIVHGLKYAFPATIGTVVIGMPTGIAAVKDISRHFAGTEALPFVWPHAEGSVTGISIAPLFPSVPTAAKNDLRLYKALALIDIIRAGAAREKEAAIEEIKMMLAV